VYGSGPSAAEHAAVLVAAARVRAHTRTRREARRSIGGKMQL
jgi:hypothetical protein